MKDMAHQFLDFCKAKPAGEEYDYYDTRNCALCQLARDVYGIRNPRAGGSYWLDEKDPSGAEHHLPDKAELVVARYPRTFGALASRLEAALIP